MGYSFSNKTGECEPKSDGDFCGLSMGECGKPSDNCGLRLGGRARMGLVPPEYSLKELERVPVSPNIGNSELTSEGIITATLKNFMYLKYSLK